MRELREWRTVNGRKLVCGMDAWNPDAPAFKLRKIQGAVAYTFSPTTGLWADVVVRFVDGSERVLRLTF